MAYCTQSQVRAIVDSDMLDAEITELIAEVQALMVSMLDTGSINAVILQGICRRWTAYNVMLKDPESSKLGEYAEDRTKALESMWEQVLFWIARADGGVNIVMGKDLLG